MQYLRKALVASGLVFMTGPLCITAQAQSYVDVEAERAGTTTTAGSAAPADPYGAKPAQAYPVTSYGVNSAPASPAVAAGAAPAPVGAQASGQNLSSLFLQIQQLQQEVMRLNGKVEEQAHELGRLKEQSLERYMDLDKRLAGGAAVAPAAAGATAGIAASQPVVTTPVSTGQTAAEQPGESAAYSAAYALVRSQKFDQAVTAFRQFQRDYPGGKYAPNAYYWLGELYLVVQPRDLESSRQSFTMLLSQYPDNSKAPDALYKLGKVQFEKGNREKAREYLDEVISKYGSTNSSAVKMARDFIAQNY